MDWGTPRSRQVSWHDPLITGRLAGRLSGRELLERIADGRLPPPPIAQLLGFELVSVGKGEALFRATPDESVYSPIGMVHGGWLCTVLDSAAGCALHTLLPAGTGYSTIELKVSFLKPIRADAGPIDVKGWVLRAGRRIAFAEAEARTSTGDLLGHATTSLALLGDPE